MAKPTPIICKHHEVTLISASTISTGITKMQGGKSYYRTWVDAGDTAPLPPENLDNPRIPVTSPWLILDKYSDSFESKTLSDIYIYCCDGDPNIDGLLEIAE